MLAIVGGLFGGLGVYRRLPIVLAVLAAVALGGCRSPWVKVRRLPLDPLAESLNLVSWGGPQPSPRVQQWLRRYDLVEQMDGAPADLINDVQQIVVRHRSPENLYVLAELAYISGKKLQRQGKPEAALDMYGISVANAYEYLLGDAGSGERNPFDPHFRQASDIYNGALESTLRMAQKQGPIRPGTNHTIRTASQTYEVAIVARGHWPGVEIQRLEFASDYEVLGLRNHYQTFGLGVPLLAVCQHHREGAAPARYYAPGMTLPMTAFLRVMPRSTRGADASHLYCVLELYDPLQTDQIDVQGMRVPLETDLTTPLAYSLNDPAFRQTEIATSGLLDPRASQAVQGLYMLEPYNRNKIPVLMVHGFWSSLITWMEMFNDLRGVPEIRDNYQFWFFLYPTGQPFWLAAAQLREELDTALNELDPHGVNPALRHLVLVGHSMGGLVCKLQTQHSGQQFWHLVSREDFDQVELDPELRELLAETLFFEPSPFVGRVITIATPHRGSRFANDVTRWLGRHVIRLPERWMRTTERLLTGGDALEDSPLLSIKTSIDSLSPNSPFLPQMLTAPRAPWTRYHNIVGLLPEKHLLGKFTEPGDGVVSYSSAHLDDVDTEIVVQSQHMNVHRHPRAVLEVQRILLEHLMVVRAEPVRRLPPVARGKGAPLRQESRRGNWNSSWKN